MRFLNDLNYLKNIVALESIKNRFIIRHIKRHNGFGFTVFHYIIP